MQIIAFLLGLVVGAFGLNYYYKLHPEDSPGYKPSTLERARQATDEKLEEWHLTPGEVKQELADKGKLVRSKAEKAGHDIGTAFSNARILSVIKAKYTLDKELSARSIDVDVDSGRVTLKGTVPSPQLIGKAVAFAFDTDGVREVESHLTVRAE